MYFLTRGDGAYTYVYTDSSRISSSRNSFEEENALTDALVSYATALRISFFLIFILPRNSFRHVSFVVPFYFRLPVFLYTRRPLRNAHFVGRSMLLKASRFIAHKRVNVYGSSCNLFTGSRRKTICLSLDGDSEDKL